MSVTLITLKSVSDDALEITGLFEKKAQFLQFPLVDLPAHHHSKMVAIRFVSVRHHNPHPFAIGSTISVEGTFPV